VQPCGVLSAYIGSAFKFPPVDLYFRNLDGHASVLNELTGSTQMLTTRAKLVSSVFSGDTMIQRFAFEVSDGAKPIFAGESVFGYFTSETMARQVGLDGGRESVPLQEQSAQAGSWLRLGQLDPAKPNLSTASGHLGILDQVFVSPQGGKHSRGYVYATRVNNPSDWYYDCHFYQDPVMPGSLGVEAVLQALQAFALEQGLGAGMRSPHFGLPQGRPIVWKYRGQIVPENRVMKLEAHITNVERTPSGATVTAEASLWADGMRIYEIRQAAISVLEG
jgi:3-hydroxymyristoyl/3-hydroxydecanoyl-(acyl carrier protein) dehydratase